MGKPPSPIYFIKNNIKISKIYQCFISLGFQRWKAPSSGVCNELLQRIQLRDTGGGRQGEEEKEEEREDDRLDLERAGLF